MRCRHHDREQQEKVDRNKQREEPVLLKSDQEVLKRDRHIESNHESPVIGVMGRRESNEFSQDKKREKGENNQKRSLSQPERDGKNTDQPPGGPNPRVNKADPLLLLGCGRAG